MQLSLTSPALKFLTKKWWWKVVYNFFILKFTEPLQSYCCPWFRFPIPNLVLVVHYFTVCLANLLKKKRVQIFLCAYWALRNVMQCQCTDKANFLTLDPDHRHQHKRHTKGKQIRKYKEIGVLPNVRDKKKKGNFFEFVYFLTILSGNTYIHKGQKSCRILNSSKKNPNLCWWFLL